MWLDFPWLSPSLAKNTKCKSLVFQNIGSSNTYKKKVTVVDWHRSGTRTHDLYDNNGIVNWKAKNFIRVMYFITSVNINFQQFFLYVFLEINDLILLDSPAKNTRNFEHKNELPKPYRSVGTSDILQSSSLKKHAPNKLKWL